MSLVNVGEKQYFSSKETVLVSDGHKQCRWVANKQEQDIVCDEQELVWIFLSFLGS